jgi:hypothetical protein
VKPAAKITAAQTAAMQRRLASARARLWEEAATMPHLGCDKCTDIQRCVARGWCGAFRIRLLTKRGRALSGQMREDN